MDYALIKKQANEILKNKTAECSYIEYKASEQQLDKIVKTICAYGNNYYNNDIQYIFIGVEEENNEKQKAIPVLPIKGITEGSVTPLILCLLAAQVVCPWAALYNGLN
jgi:predicted HTH transcriptional regulator